MRKVCVALILNVRTCARVLRLQAHSWIRQVVPRIGAKALNTTGLVTSAHFFNTTIPHTTACSGLKG